MCGIAGVLTAEPVVADASATHARVARMLSLMAERGPDAEGVWAGDHACLGHRRLRIIDLSTAADQPMVSASGNEVVVFNGEIYNHHALRRRLEQAGHRFRSRSDTEVLLHGYQEWGADLAPRLEGMFAFALWDARRGRLLLARDRMGKKPLYYAKAGDTLLFASDVKALVAGLERTPDIDYQAVDCYLTLFSVPTEHCVYQGVRKLPPAHAAVVDVGGPRDPSRGPAVQPYRYWQPALEPKIAWEPGAVLDRVDHALRSAVRRRLESDVPLAVFLSGGIDSSLVTAMAAQECGPGLKTVTVRFDETGHDEGPYAAAVARRYGTEHTEIHLSPADLDVVPELVWQYGEPFADSSSIAQYQVARAVKELATVVLTGDGGDEIFGGYRRYALGLPAVWLRTHALDHAPDWTSAAAARMLAGPARLWPDPMRGALGALDCRLPPYSLFHTWLLDRDRLLAPEFRVRLAGHHPGHAHYAAGSPRFAGPGGVAEGSGFAGWGGVARTGLVGGWGGAARPGGAGIGALDHILLSDLAYWLPADMLTKVDVATMAASVEARSPLLDRQVVELAALLTTRAKMHPSGLKHVLRQLAARYLPADIVTKPKWGFVVPVDRWLRGPLTPVFRDILVGQTARSRGLFDYDYVARVLGEHVDGRANHKHRLWSLVCLELWFRMFVDGTLKRGDGLA